MEGAIKLLKFCMEQKEKGFDIWFSFVPHTEWIELRYYNEDGRFKMNGINEEWYMRYFNTSGITPERADEIINEIKEKLK